jgi:hypothetical protein
MKTTFLQIGLAMLPFLVACQRTTAQTTIIAYNLSAGLDYLQTISTTDASRFTVDLHDVDVTSVQFFLSAGSLESYQTTAYLFSDSNGKPGNIVASSSQTYTPVGQNFSAIIYTFANPLTLTAGDAYWVGCGTSTQGQLFVGSIDGLSGFADNGATPSFNICINGYFPPDAQGWGGVYEETTTLAYQLDGYVVPEPSTVTLSLVGAAILLVSLRIKHRISIL